mmetsp:Transcript_12290/g.30605  ORF Transcript_12290/g.30605 Transcript_12290/m.30605 type:complete len:193 (-) Transcript_12290:317-895(-)
MGTRYDDEERRDRSRSRSPYRDGGRDREGGGGRGGSVTSGGGGGGGGGKDQGVALRWNAERGFGFIKPDDGGEDLFCHYSSITDGGALEEGSKVWYTKSYDDRKGKDRAENVTGGIPESRGPPGGGFGGGGGGGGGECYDFQKGRCTRGSSCKFSHGTGDSGGGYGGGGGGRYGGGYGGGDRYGGGGDGGRY